MSDLVEFLLARIADDEATARAASEGGLVHFSHWEVGRSSVHAGLSTVKDVGRAAVDAESTTREYATHSARWDPARVLAECDAKQRIVERFRAMAEWPEFTDPDMHEPLEFHARESAIEDGQAFLRLLALPYADHPDYRQEWRP